MATANIPTETETFDDQLSQIKIQIERYFLLLLNSLKKRERELLTELEEIASRHQREKEQHKQSLSEIEFMLKQTHENIHSNVLKETKTGIVKMLEQQQREIKSKLNSKCLLFVFDNTLLDRIRRIKIKTVFNPKVPTLPVVDYKNKVKPVLSIGKAGKTEGQFNTPWGVSVDYTTDNIYVADQQNNRVQVLDRNGRYLFKFGDTDGAVLMYQSFTIAISAKKVFVTSAETKCILVYDLNGTFIKQIGKEGSGDGEFLSPFGIAINEVNGDIYVCDLVSNRVQIFSKDYSFISHFGNGILQSPRDIKLTRDYIFVLCEKNPFLVTFDNNLTQVHNVISKSISEHFNRPFGMVIDGAGKLIISDYKNHAVFIFNPKGELLHKLTDSISRPAGVAIDSQGRIIVVSLDSLVLIF